MVVVGARSSRCTPHAGDHGRLARAAELAAGSAVLLRLNGVGAVFGPVVGASLMARHGPQMFYWTMAVTNALIVVYISWRAGMREPLPTDRQRPFMAFPPRASELAAGLLTRRARPGDSRQSRNDSGTG
ncbi:MAG: hypothetical protein R2695_04640 [Acidimicrobiales bacterium]